MKSFFVALTMVLGSAAAMADTSLLQNGSFDQQSLTDGQVITSTAATAVDGWYSSGAVKLVDPLADSKYASTTDGSNFVKLVNGAMIYQSFTTVPGAMYTLTFSWDAVKTAASYLVLGGSTASGTLNSGTSTNFQTTTLTFSALSNSTTLAFLAGTSGNLLVDNVAVAMVPEPASIALFLAGLGALGLVSRRRRLKK